MLQGDTGHHLEQLAGGVLRRADAGRAEVDLSGIGLGIGDEFRDVFGGQIGIDLHDQRHVHDVGDRRDVLREIEAEMGVERGVDRIGRAAQQEGVAIRRRPDHRFGADIAAGTRTVLDHDRLPEPLRQ